MMKYLRKAPTLIVIGVTGFVGWTIFFTEGDSGPPKATAKPSVTARPSTSGESVTLRDPFQVDRPPSSTLTSTQAVTSTSTPTSTPVVDHAPGSSANLASLNSDPQKGVLLELAQDEDRILSEMRLVGTFIDDREKLALIDNKIYARGDQLRGADGSLLPYVVMEVRPDRALVRRGRRDFVIAFSDIPRMTSPKAIAPAQSKAMAKVETAANPATAAKAKGPGSNGQPPSNSGDPKEMILQLLSGLGASSAGGSPGSSSGGSLNPNTLGAGVNQNSISAGLDALMGKFDNIGREGDGSTSSNPGGGTTP